MCVAFELVYSLHRTHQLEFEVDASKSWQRIAPASERTMRCHRQADLRRARLRCWRRAHALCTLPKVGNRAVPFPLLSMFFLHLPSFGACAMAVAESRSVPTDDVRDSLSKRPAFLVTASKVFPSSPRRSGRGTERKKVPYIHTYMYTRS